MGATSAALGPMVQEDANGADFIVQGNVLVWYRSLAVSNGVEIQWVVKAANGDGNGARLCSSTNIAAGSLNHYSGGRRRGGGDRGGGGCKRRDHAGGQSGAARPGEPVHGQGAKPLCRRPQPTGVEPVR